VKRRNSFLTILLLSLLIFGLDRVGAFSWLKAGLARLTGELRTASYQKMVGPIDHQEEAKKQLVSCRTEVLALREENSRLRKLLGAGIKPETKLLLARVIGSNQSQLIVALTSQDGIKKGASVVTERILLGRVEKIEGNTARVSLLTNSELRIPVKIWLTRQLAETGELNLAEGILTSSGGKLVVKEILASEKVAPDYWVGAVVESGDVFLIGQIKKVYPSEDKVFQEAEVEWVVNPKKLLTVGIIRND